MLERSYSFAIEDLEDEGPKPAEEERLRARQLALSGRVVSSGSRDDNAQVRQGTPIAQRERRLRLPAAAADFDFVAPALHQIAAGVRRIREIAANADVAQLVEHFTRN